MGMVLVIQNTVVILPSILNTAVMAIGIMNGDGTCYPEHNGDGD